MKPLQRGFMERLERSVKPVAFMQLELKEDVWSFATIVQGIWKTSPNEAKAFSAKVDIPIMYQKQMVGRFMRKTRKRILRTIA